MANKHGGARIGAGRKPVVAEQKHYEELDKMSGFALRALEHGLKAKQPWAVREWLKYCVQLPAQRVDQTTIALTPTDLIKELEEDGSEDVFAD